MTLPDVNQLMQELESQKEVAASLRAQLIHLQIHADNLREQVNIWHRIADDRSNEIQRLLGKLEAKGRKEL